MKRNISVAVLLLIVSLCVPINIFAEGDVPEVKIEDKGNVIINSNDEVLFESETPNIVYSKEINPSDVLLGDDVIIQQETTQSVPIDNMLVENEVDDIIDDGTAKNVTFDDNNSDSQLIIKNTIEVNDNNDELKAENENTNEEKHKINPSLIISIVLAIIAVLQFFLNYSSRRKSEIVVIPEIIEQGFYLVIKNTGKKHAKSVKIVFENEFLNNLEYATDGDINQANINNINGFARGRETYRKFKDNLLILNGKGMYIAPEQSLRIKIASDKGFKNISKIPMKIKISYSFFKKDLIIIDWSQYAGILVSK